MTIFELENGLYVSSVPKPSIHEIYFFDFSKWRIFSNSYLFSGKTAFLQISATGFKKLFFHLKARQTRMQRDTNNFSGEIREKHKFQNQLDVLF